MPSALELFHGLCATTLLGYLAGWPAQRFGGVRRGRLRFYGVGLVVALAALALAGWSPLVAFVLAAVGTAVAMGLFEAARYRRLRPAVEPEWDPDFGRGLDEAIVTESLDHIVPHLVEEPIEPRARPSPPRARVAPRPQQAPVQSQPGPEPTPEPEPEPVQDPPRPLPRKGMLGPLEVEPGDDTMHGHALLGPLDPKEAAARRSHGKRPVAISCAHCGRPNPFDATSCVHCGVTIDS